MFHVNHLLGMKCQDLFSLKNEKKKLECRLLQILLGALRVKSMIVFMQYCTQYFQSVTIEKIVKYNKS